MSFEARARGSEFLSELGAAEPRKGEGSTHVGQRHQVRDRTRFCGDAEPRKNSHARSLLFCSLRCSACRADDRFARGGATSTVEGSFTANARVRARTVKSGSEAWRLPSGRYHLRSSSRTSRTFHFPDSRDLLEVLGELSWQRERGGSLGNPPGP